MPVVVLYDHDCGFCRWSLARLLTWDRERRLRPVAIQSAEGQELLRDVPPAERLRSAHAVGEDGVLRSGGAAAPVVLRALPRGAPVALVAAVLSPLTRAGYRLVADNRTFFGRFISAERRAAADAVLADRR